MQFLVTKYEYLYQFVWVEILGKKAEARAESCLSDRRRL